MTAKQIAMSASVV